MYLKKQTTCRCFAPTLKLKGLVLIMFKEIWKYISNNPILSGLVIVSLAGLFKIIIDTDFSNFLGFFTSKIEIPYGQFFMFCVVFFSTTLLIPKRIIESMISEEQNSLETEQNSLETEQNSLETEQKNHPKLADEFMELVLWVHHKVPRGKGLSASNLKSNLTGPDVHLQKIQYCMDELAKMYFIRHMNEWYIDEEKIYELTDTGRKFLIETDIINKKF